MNLFEFRIDLSELICGRTTEWIECEDNLGEASKVWVYVPAIVKESKDELDMKIYSNQIDQYL
jgi:hypothetical protein